MSTIIPRRFISRTTSLPNAVRPLCAGLSVDGVGPVVVLEMRQRHVAHAERRVDAQQPQVVVDHVAALHPHQRGDLAAPRRPGGRPPRSSPASGRSGCRRTASRTASIWSSARFTAGGPVTSLGTQIEKNTASSPPSRMRGTSMLPFFWRTEMSKVLSKTSRCVRVVVRIDDDRAIVQLLRARRHAVGRGGLREDEASRDQRPAAQSAAHADETRAMRGRRRRESEVLSHASRSYRPAPPAFLPPALPAFTASRRFSPRLRLAPELSRLLVSQRHHRVDPHGAPRRECSWPRARSRTAAR